MAEQRLIDANELKTSEERKTGKWIIRDVEDFKGRPTGKHFIICDQCGEKEIISFQRRPFDFCHNCGAKMGTSHE